MSDIDRFADIYLNFQDRQQWFAETFASMTLREYMEFVDYCFKELDFSAEAKEAGEFRRVKGLLLALARKDLEIAHFMPELTDEQRALSITTATFYYELAKGFYSVDAVPDVEAGWNSSLDYAARFGWPSISFDTWVPHQVFRDPIQK